MRKIAIYSPYLDTFGGGEKYILTIAEECLRDSQVEILLDSHLSGIDMVSILNSQAQIHGLKLNQAKLVEAPLGAGIAFWRKFLFLQKYDWLIYNTDGSLFVPSAKHNLIVYQIPVKNANFKHSFWERIKQASWHYALFNSHFTKNIVQNTWSIKGEVLYPPVDVDILRPLRKQRVILSVGRFVEVKKHDVLIKAFKKLVSGRELKNWSLVLAGSLQDKVYFERLKQEASRIDIKFYPDISRGELIKLYGEASIFWHAMGFGQSNPKDFEHFGISVVEAMASGAVPLIFKGGGLPEIVADKESGFLWQTIDDLTEQTLELVRLPELMNKVSLQAIVRAQKFSKSHFQSRIRKIIYG